MWQIVYPETSVTTDIRSFTSKRSEDMSNRHVFVMETDGLLWGTMGYLYISSVDFNIQTIVYYVTYEEVEVKHHTFLISALQWGRC